MAWRAWLPDEPLRPWQATLLAAALAGAATAARAALEAPVGRELPFITYFPALIFAAILGGTVGGLTCLLLSTVAAWYFFLSGGAPPAWAIGSFAISGGLIVAVAAALAENVRELRRSRKRLDEAQARLETLVGELAHRNRNGLSVIAFIVRQSARAATSVADAERIINERLGALAGAQQVVIESRRARAGLRALLDTIVAPFGPDRFVIAASPDVEVAAEPAAALGLLFHELATNALKHGALSNGEGQVAIDWTFEDGAAHLHWRETGGPAVTEPVQQGFGTRLTAAVLSPFGGSVTRRFEPDGAICELVLPATPGEGERAS